MHQVLDLTQYSSESDLDTNSFLTEFPLSKDPNSSGSEPSRELYADQVFCPFGQRNMYSSAQKESKVSESKPAPKLNAMNLFAFRVSCYLPHQRLILFSGRQLHQRVCRRAQAIVLRAAKPVMGSPVCWPKAARSPLHQHN